MTTVPRHNAAASFILPAPQFALAPRRPPPRTPLPRGAQQRRVSMRPVAAVEPAAGAANAGNKWQHSAESRARISAGLRRFYDSDPRADETRKTQREKKRGAKNPMFNRRHSDEAREKMRQARRGRSKSLQMPDEVRKKISDSMKRHHEQRRRQTQLEECRQIDYAVEASRKNMILNWRREGAIMTCSQHDAAVDQSNCTDK